jgi:hypothetical protein
VKRALLYISLLFVLTCAKDNQELNTEISELSSRINQLSLKLNSLESKINIIQSQSNNTYINNNSQSINGLNQEINSLNDLIESLSELLNSNSDSIESNSNNLVNAAEMIETLSSQIEILINNDLSNKSLLSNQNDTINLLINKVDNLILYYNSLDTDNDGVPNLIDECIDTVARYQISETCYFVANGTEVIPGNYSIFGSDSYGDGWNGANLEITIDGVTNVWTFESGANDNISFTVPENASSFSLKFNGGDWDSEVSYIIEYSSLDNTLQGVVLNAKKYGFQILSVCSIDVNESGCYD